MNKRILFSVLLSWLILQLGLVSSISQLPFLPSQVLATIEKSSQVSVTVVQPSVSPTPTPTPVPPGVDLIPPTAPILIAPENSAYIATNQPDFIFLASTDEGSGIAKYQLFLDSKLFIDNITSSLSTITITAPSDLTDGKHVWYVKVFDYAGNYAFSSTWHFTVDTEPPFVIIITIEETPNLNFSSIDLTTLPPGVTVTTRSHQPAFFGRGEPGATIQINLQDKKSYQLITTVAEDGSFVLIPDQDLANDTYQVTVISFDQAGNTILLPTFTLVVEAPPRFVIPICWLIVLLLLIIIALLSYLYYRERRRHQEHHRKP